MKAKTGNKGRNIVISGTYGVGKTTTTKELARVTGIPTAVARGMREILPDTFPGKRLEECNGSELLQLGLIRFGERNALESKLPDGFVTDGSALHEWAYGYGRQLESAQGDGKTIGGSDFEFAMRTYGDVVKRHSKQNYTDIVHLPVEFPIPNDGHRPVSEAFRNKADEIIKGTWNELGFKVHEVNGSVDERIIGIVSALNLEVSPTLNGPIVADGGKVWYDNADDMLGDGSKRFFSNGFRNVTHELGNIMVDPRQNRITSDVSLGYVGQWSSKNGEVCDPHLSSIDSVLVAGQMAQMLMFTQDDITRDEANNLWLRELQVKPGRKAIEDVSKIPVTMDITKAAWPKMQGKYWHTANVEAVIGEDFRINAKVGYELPERLQSTPRARVVARSDSAEDLSREPVGVEAKVD